MPRSTLVVVALLTACNSGAAKSSAPPAKGTLAMAVTENGFEPNELHVKQGEPVTLLVTRKTDATCAKAIVIDEYNVHVDLPLDKEVKIAFTPNKTGKIKYGCAMDKMVWGTLFIE